MQSTKKMLVVLFALMVVVGLASVASACPVWLGDYVWQDDNWNGLQDEGIDAGINGVRVIFWRDYECDGVVNNYDEIFDFQYTRNDADGLPGWYLIPAVGNRCYVAEVDMDYAPGLYLTTNPMIAVAPLCEDVLDIDFGFSTEEKPQIDFTCPKTIGFWKQQLEQSRAAKYTQAEVNQIVAAALELTPVFANAADLKAALLSKGNAGPLMRAKRQFAGFVLNVAAFELIGDVDYTAGLGFDTPLDLPNYTDAETVGDAFLEVEGYILGQTNLGDANDIADAINNGLGLELDCEL